MEQKVKKEMGNYSVYLNKKLIKEVKIKMRIGQKLSPVINELLKRWVLEQKW